MTYSFNLNYTVEIYAGSFEEAKEMALKMIPYDAEDKDMEYLGQSEPDYQDVIFDMVRERDL